MNLATDKACCNMELREGCRIIALVLMILMAIVAAISQQYLVYSPMLIGWILHLMSNLALLLGAQLENQCLVLVWVSIAVFVICSGPIAIVVILCNLNTYREDTQVFSIMVVSIFLIIINTVVYCYLFQIVFSYWKKLHNRLSDP